MGLFNFFKKNGVALVKNNGDGGPVPEIAKDGFNRNQDILTTSDLNRGLEQIYSFLQADYEGKGYNDALVNPDDSYKSDNIRLIKLDLQILIDKTTTYYDNLLSELSLHIVTRSRAGLIDLVQELESRKKLIEDYKQKIKIITDNTNDENGMCQRIILSYQRGFMRGLSAITHLNVLNKKL